MEKKSLLIRLVETMFLLTLILVATMLYVSPIEAIPKQEPEKKTIPVAKHIVKGSNVTKEQLKKWDETANKLWGCSLKFVVQGDPDEVNSTGDNKVAGAVNVYGVPVNPDWYGRATDQDMIEVAADAKDDTLAHEFGHFPGGDVSDADHVQNDTENLMYSGCARNGTKVTDKQQERARRLADEWLKKANAHKTGSGKDIRDAVGDVTDPFIDITYADMWALYDTLSLSIIVHSFVNTSYELGYLIESDNDPRTGEPPFGMDYKVHFDPQQNHIHFCRYDIDWVPLDPDDISVKYLYEVLDVKVPVPTLPLQNEIGIEFVIPLFLLTRRAPHGPADVISFVAFGQFGSLFDYCPDIGFSSIRPIWEHDVAILSVTPSKTIVGVGTTMSIGVIVWNEGNFTETFSVSAFYNATPIGTLPVTSLSPGNETTLLFSWDTTGLPKGRYSLSASAPGVPGETDLIDNDYYRWGTIQAAMAGDINADLVVDIFDIVIVAAAFGSSSGDPNWSANADVEEDNLIDIFDLVWLAASFGNVDPP